MAAGPGKLGKQRIVMQIEQNRRLKGVGTWQLSNAPIFEQAAFNVVPFNWTLKFATMRYERFSPNRSDLFEGKWWDVVQKVVAAALLLSFLYGAYNFYVAYQALTFEAKERERLSSPPARLPRK